MDDRTLVNLVELPLNWQVLDLSGLFMILVNR